MASDDMKPEQYLLLYRWVILMLTGIYISSLIALGAIGRSAFRRPRLTSDKDEHGSSVKSDWDGPKVFGLVFQRSVPLITVALVILALIVLAMFGELKSGALGVLGSIAAYVLGSAEKKTSDTEDKKTPTIADKKTP